LYPQDDKLQSLLAKTYAALGRIGAQHRAQASAYAIRGQLPMAIEQLQLAQKEKDNDFYEQSVIDARLRELKAQQMEEAKRR
jgi:predicted Zn-dependent protease